MNKTTVNKTCPYTSAYDIAIKDSENGIYIGNNNVMLTPKYVLGVKIPEENYDPKGLDTAGFVSFGSDFYEDGKHIYLKEVIYNGPVTICNWSDGSKTTAKIQQGDTYSPEVGLLLCVFKRIKGNQFVQDLINYWAPENGEKKITLRDVFKKYKSK